MASKLCARVGGLVQCDTEWLSYARDSDFDSEPLSTKMSAVPAVLELGFGQLSLALYDSDTGLGEVLVLLFR